MSKKISLSELRRLVEQVIKEEENASRLEIDITKDQPDERDPIRRKGPPTYKVYYYFEQDGLSFEFDGSLKPYHTGRDYDYEFEPSWFADDESEEYYSENWENIEEQILQKFYEEPR